MQFDEPAVLILAVVFAILLIGAVVFVVRGTIVAARQRISEIIEAEHLQGVRSFTDRTRKALDMAEQEARHFKHQYVGTEHILLGLLREGSGVAAHALKKLKVNLAEIRREVKAIVQSGPKMVSMGRLPLTPRAKDVIEYANAEARDLNHNYVGTEHLLLGLIREEEGVAAQVLLNLGVTLVAVRDQVVKLLGQSGLE